MRLWLARDKKDGKLCVYEHKPLKTNSYFLRTDGFFIEINKEYYPEVAYKNSPLEMEVRL